MVHIGMRVLVGILGVVAGVAAIGLYLRWPVVLGYVPWSSTYAESSPLSYFLLSALAAAVCAPMLWIALSGELHRAAPGPAKLAVGLLGVAMIQYQALAANPENSTAVNVALLAFGVVVFGAAVIVLARSAPQRPARPTPGLVRFAVRGTTAGLIVVGGAMVLRVPGLLPWDVGPDATAWYGQAFLGAAVYFHYAAVTPRWEAAAGQMMGLLAYDLVLILPFLRHFSEVRSEHLPGLIAYTVVAVSSGALAAYYLFLHPDTKYFGTVRPNSATRGGANGG